MDRRDGRSLYGFEWGGQELLDRVRDKCCHLLAGRTVCEIGCGGGKWTKWLYDACNARHVVAVDVHESAIASTLAYEPRATAMLLSGDELPSLSADVVFSYDVFLHLPRDLVVRYMQQAIAVAEQMIFALPDIILPFAKKQMLQQVEMATWRSFSHTSLNFYTQGEVSELSTMTGWCCTDMGVIECDQPRDRMYVLRRKP